MTARKTLLSLAFALSWIAGPVSATVVSEMFPNANELFARLLADPRQIQLSAAYYKLNGNNSADISLGHSWGMARWHSTDSLWFWQWNIEGMAFSRFKLSGAVNEFQTVDFFANVPLEVRHGIYSGKFMLFHESSHLGDDYIRRTSNTGFRYSVDGLRALFSAEPWQFLRGYGGATFLMHSIPSPKRGALQYGFELSSPEYNALRDTPVKAYLAQDFQFHENVSWNMNSRTAIGINIGFKEVIRSMRLQIGYFKGHSPYGQFFAVPEQYTDIGISFDL
ncbi:MAG: DUF1207 domain-containing protein [Elusimicrobia bacterium]|nr:DUF1207 domain-containing protein [Elusimicrobiota bacterium]